MLLTVIVRCEVPYHAFFVSDRQSTEFQVFPQTGILPPPASGPGARITVGFVPRSYGRTCITRLVVQVYNHCTASGNCYTGNCRNISSATSPYPFPLLSAISPLLCVTAGILNDGIYLLYQFSVWGPTFGLK